MTRKATADTPLKTLRREVRRRAEAERQTSIAWRRGLIALHKSEQQVAELKADIEGWKARFDALLRRDQA